MPNQNPRKPFAAWRLPNGIMKATEEELAASVESCETWAWGCGGLVVVGLLAELALAILHPPYDSVWERWVPIIGNALIALGVAGEILFARMGFARQSELQRVTDKLLSEAWSMADKAGDDAYKATRMTEELRGVPPPWERYK
jgi:hypothetical protein